MIFYTIAASPHDVIVQIQNNVLWFNPEMAKTALEHFSKGSRIYKVLISEEG